MTDEVNINLARIIKQQRLSIPLTLRELSAMSGVSASHLGRIERGERFPSGAILRRIAKPLGFEEDELFTMAGYLTTPTPSVAEDYQRYGGQLDPYVAKVLSQEPPEVQRAVIGLLKILKSLAKSQAKETQESKEEKEK